MIQTVNSALLEMQGALLARSLYPDDHPRIDQSERRALDLLQQLLEKRPDITICSVDDRVIFDGPSTKNATINVLGVDFEGNRGEIGQAVEVAFERVDDDVVLPQWRPRTG